MSSLNKILSRFFTAAIALSAACGEHATAPLNAGRAVHSANAAAVAAEAADSRLTVAQRTRLDSLRASLTWVGELHHQAMQEALHDPAAGTFTSRGPGSAACAAQIRYAVRYASLVDSIAEVRGFAHGQRDGDPAQLASQVGVCRSNGIVSLPQTALGRYTAAMVAALGRVATLPQALAAIDQQLVVAAADQSLSPDELTSIVALGSLAASSANEWFAYAANGRPRGTAIRPSGPSLGMRANDASSWTSGVMGSDLDGCGSGSDASSCTVGGIAGSLFSW